MVFIRTLKALALYSRPNKRRYRDRFSIAASDLVSLGRLWRALLISERLVLGVSDYGSIRQSEGKY